MAFFTLSPPRHCVFRCLRSPPKTLQFPVSSVATQDTAFCSVFGRHPRHCKTARSDTDVQIVRQTWICVLQCLRSPPKTLCFGSGSSHVVTFLTPLEVVGPAVIVVTFLTPLEVLQSHGNFSDTSRSGDPASGSCVASSACL